jgi:hypothetical protein
MMNAERTATEAQPITLLLPKMLRPSEITKGDSDSQEKKDINEHIMIVKNIANAIMAKEDRKFEIDEHNKKVLMFLLLYFNRDKQAEEVFPEENYKIHKPLMLMGKPGVGKTVLMDIFGRYLKFTKNPNLFYNTSVTEIINYYKVNNHIDRYTFNYKGFDNRPAGYPVNLCLNDLGLRTHMHFGVDTKVFIDDFLYARNEIFIYYKKMAHITTNLDVNELKEAFDYRLAERFKCYNIIDLGGESRRK